MDGYTRHQFFIQIGNLNIVITELHLCKTITEVSSKILQHIVAQLDVRSKLNKSREDELDFLSDKKYSVAYHFKRNITKDTILLPKNSRHNNEEGLFNKCKIHNRKLFIVVDINQLKSEPTSKYFFRVVEISKSAVKKKKSLKKIAAQSEEESVSEVERNINFSDFTLITSHFKRRTPQRIKFPQEKMSAPFSFADDVTCSSKNDRKRKKCSALKKETAADVRDTNLSGTISEKTKCDTGKVSKKHVVKGVFESDLLAAALFKQDVSKRIEPNKFYPAKSPPQRKTKTFDIQYKGTKIQSNSTQNNRSQCKKTQSSGESDSEDFVEKLKTKKKLSHKENNKNSEESEKYKRPKRKKETQSDEKTSSKNESSKDTEKRKKNISSTKENSKNDKNFKKGKKSSASSSKTQRLTFEELINEKGDDEEDDDDLPEIPSVGKLSEVLSNLEEENISPQLEKNRKASAHLTTEEIKTALSQLKVDIQSIFNDETECERHQLYKNGGKDRASLRMEGNLGFLPEQQEEYIGELLLKMFCLEHSKYFDYIMKVLLPETIILVYAKVKDVSIKEARRIIDT